MKKVTTLLSAIMLTLSSVLYSCKDMSEENVSPATAQTEPDVTVAGSFLKFKNADVFVNTLNVLAALDSTELVAWQSKNGLAVSLRSHFDQLSQEEVAPQPNADLYSTNKAFATVLNADGAYQVGDEIHKILGKKEFILKPKDQALLTSIESDPDKSYAGVKVFNIVSKNLNVEKSKNLRSGSDSPIYAGGPKYYTDLFDGDYYQEFYPYQGQENRLRFRVTAKYTAYSNYINHYAKIEGRKKVQSFPSDYWKYDEMHYAYIKLNGTVHSGANNYILSIRNDGENYKNITIDWNQLIPNVTSISGYSILVRYEDDGFPLVGTGLNFK